MAYCSAWCTNVRTRGQRPPNSTPLHLACTSLFYTPARGADCAYVSLEAFADINARDHRDMTPLMHAVGTAALPQLEVLFRKESSLDLRATNKDGRNAYDLVNQRGAPQSVQRKLRDLWRRRGLELPAFDKTATRSGGQSSANRRVDWSGRGRLFLCL